MRVALFGLGYVGSVTAACLAKAGHEVVGVDISAEKVAMVNAATPPVVEPGLAELLAEVVGAGRLRATTSSDEAVAASDMSLICVGTPGRSNGQLEVEAVVRTGERIGAALRQRAEPHVVVLRSTVLPGTTETRLLPALRAAAGEAATIPVAVNPEFMREGSSLRDFANPPLTLVGCSEPSTAAVLHAARVADVALPVLSSILPSNEAQVRRGVEAVLATRRPRIGVVGLAFKAGTDDLRESPMVTLVETLIGKGCDVRILDRNVAMARLLGANRRYIEEEIPHIASLMCSGVEALLAHAQVLVIGSGGEDAAETLAAASDAHLVVDLTRGAVRRDRG